MLSEASLEGVAGLALSSFTQVTAPVACDLPDRRENPMSIRASAYITFTGNAEEALTFYHSVFGGNLEIDKYGDMPDTEFPFEPEPEWVAHGDLTGPVNISGGDGGDQPLKSHVYSFLVYSDSIEEGRALLEKLSADGGEKAMAYEEAPWGDHYGQVRDRFGVLWAVEANEN